MINITQKLQQILATNDENEITALKPFESDKERLEYLFKMYEDMTSKEGI